MKLHDCAEIELTTGRVGSVYVEKNTPDIGQRVKRAQLPAKLPEYIKNEVSYLSQNRRNAYAYPRF